MFAIFCKRQIRVPPKNYFFVSRWFHTPASETCPPNVCENDSVKAFTVSYLINSCGLSSAAAASASKKLCLKTPEKPDAVLKFLKEYGFTDAHIHRLVTRWPRVLVACPDKNLFPKLEFFRSIGVPLPVLAQKLSAEPSVLTRSLENSIVPTYKYLLSVLQTDEKVALLFYRTPGTFGRCLSDGISSNISLLRERGVPESSIVSMLRNRQSLLTDKKRLADYVDRAVEMGFDLSKISFTRAIQVFVGASESTLKSKREVYRRCGWSESEINAAFLRHPFCMNISEKKIMANMNFLVDKIGFEPAAIAKFPVIINLSLEKRIKPRCMVTGILNDNGLLKITASGMAALLKLSEDKFMDKYIVKYKKKIPDILDIYLGKSSREAKQLRLTLS